MSSRIMLIPVGTGVGLTSVSMGLVRAFQQQGVSVNFFKPVAQQRQQSNDKAEKSTSIISQVANVSAPQPIETDYVEQMISENKMDVLLEDIVEQFETLDADNSVTVIEGLVTTRSHTYAAELNKAIATALDAKIVLVAAPRNLSARQLNDKLEIVADSYGGHRSRRVLGCIFNKANAPTDKSGRIRADLEQNYHEDQVDAVLERLDKLKIFSKSFRHLGAVTWNFDLVAPRVIDVAKHLGATMMFEGDYEYRRLKSIHFCAREISNMIDALKPGALLVLSGDRSDVLVSACLAVMNGTKIGAILLTGGYKPNEKIMQLCEQAFETGLPMMQIPENTWQTSMNLAAFDQEVPTDDVHRIEKVMDHTAACIDRKWIKSLSQGMSREARLSPPAFRHKLSHLARKAKKTVVLPEGNEPRTVVAAATCAQRGIANCVLLGDPIEIARVAEQHGIDIPEGVSILNPQEIRGKYIEPLVELRKHKGMNELAAEEYLSDNVVLGTMMLQQDDVDGLVSGAVHTTANTIRPALQLIKTAEGASLVSSIFFMLLPEQVLVYGDCAINPDPNAEQLADIAIQSADSAATFGIPPKVAMISYSTGESGTGQDVDKVREATRLAKAKRPDLIIDGPLQYDAAVMESVAAKKAPNSPVAGQATVIVFPDLNTGNTTYKAVQRSADLISIGPMLQGMKKPVNDLSRGALVDDIIYTIALTAIQATQ